MTPTRAVSIFAKLINDRELQCWDRLQGGCEYRAEVAAQRIRKMGYEPLKAWAFPEIRPDGRETFCLGQRRQDPETAPVYFTWGFHAAVAAFVDIGHASPQVMVFDPTLMDGPCMPDEWMSAMYATRGRFMLTLAEVFLVDPTARMAFLPSPGDDVVRREVARMKGVVQTQLPRVKARGAENVR